MGWEEYFHKLTFSKQESKDEEERQKIEKAAVEMQIGKQFSPQIERVCRGFAKAFGWEYEKIPDYWFECHDWDPYYSGSGSNFGYAILVVPERNAIRVDGSYHPASDSFSSWQESRTIPLNEFTEERLAKIFEDFARKCGVI